MGVVLPPHPPKKQIPLQSLGETHLAALMAPGGITSPNVGMIEHVMSWCWRPTSLILLCARLLSGCHDAQSQSPSAQLPNSNPIRKKTTSDKLSSPAEIDRPLNRPIKLHSPNFEATHDTRGQEFRRISKWSPANKVLSKPSVPSPDTQTRCKYLRVRYSSRSQSC